MCKEWEICKWGNWEVILYDRLSPKIKLDECLLNRIFKLRPKARRLLLVLDEKGFKNKKGAAFCHNLEKCIGSDDRICFSRALWPEHPKLPKFPEWDYGVVLPRKTVRFIQKGPAYFTFILGHELEHVELYSSNYFCALHGSWLYDNLERLTYVEDLPKCYTFPIEKHCHREGGKMAISLFSEQHFIDTIEKVLTCESEQKNINLLRWVKPLSEEEPCLNLRKEFIEFCQPYKGALRNLFDKDLKEWKKEGRRGQYKPLATEIKNFDDIFDVNYTG